MQALSHNLRLPLFQAPMFLLSGPAMVIAACKAGVLGSFPTPNCRSTGDLEAWLQEISAAVDPELYRLGHEVFQHWNQLYPLK